MVTLKALALAVALTGAGPASHGSTTAVLDFSADWCGPCQSMRPLVERLQAEGYPVEEVNVDRQQDLAARFHVTSIPCFVLVIGGREVDRTVGATSYDRLVRMAKRAQTSRKSVPVTAPPAGPVAPVAATGLNRPTTNSPQAVGPPGPATPVPATLAAAPSTPLPPTAAASSPDAIETAIMQSTVRIRVDDPSGRSYGTGTIIDARGGKALVLTCGHLFRESREDGHIFVDLFSERASRTVPAHLISYDLTRDLGLLAIRPGNLPVRVARVAPKGHKIAPGDRVSNVGCNNAEPPTIRATHVTAIDRYEGPPNIEAAGTPVEGRSGGGLFDRNGRLIGVCFAADGTDNEGLYTGLAAIHAELDRVGLGFVCATDSAPPTTTTAVAQTAPPPLPKHMPITAPERPAAGGPPRRNSALASSQPQPSDGNRPAAQLSPSERVALAEIRHRSRGGEVICIVRPADPNEKSEIFVLENVSPQFVKQLTQRRSPKTSPRLTSLDVRKPAHPRRPSPQEVIDARGWETVRR